MATARKRRSKRPSRVEGKRSKFEVRIADDLELHEVYETVKFTYVKTHTYTPDFEIAPDVFIETKGYFKASDRTKMLDTVKQNPGITFVLYFMNAFTKIHKKSEMTYADWSDKHGFPWFCEKTKPMTKGDIKLLNKLYSKVKT